MQQQFIVICTFTHRSCVKELIFQIENHKKLSNNFSIWREEYSNDRRDNNLASESQKCESLRLLRTTTNIVKRRKDSVGVAAFTIF